MELRKTGFHNTTTTAEKERGNRPTPYRYITPMVREPTGVLPTRSYTSPLFEKQRNILNDYMQNLKLNGDENIDDIWWDCMNKNNIITKKLLIEFYDFDSLLKTPNLKTNGVLSFKLYNNDHKPGEDPWIKGNRFFGVDETKWYIIQNGYYKEL